MKCTQSSSKDLRSQGYASNRYTSRCENASAHIINSPFLPASFPVSQSLRGWLTYSIKKINIKQERKCVLSLSDWLKKKGRKEPGNHSGGNQCRNTSRATDSAGQYLSADVTATHYKNDNTNLSQQIVASGGFWRKRHPCRKGNKCFFPEHSVKRK